MREWNTGERMKWARDAYWYGADEYALEVLMEIAQEEINNDVQETFDLSCQPRPVRKKRPKPTIRSKFAGGHSQGHGIPTFDAVAEALRRLD